MCSHPASHVPRRGHHRQHTAWFGPRLRQPPDLVPDALQEELALHSRRDGLVLVLVGDIPEVDARVGLAGLEGRDVEDELNLAPVGQRDGSVDYPGDGPAVLFFEEVDLGCGTYMLACRSKWIKKISQRTYP